jgi:hypothetical protein
MAGKLVKSSTGRTYRKTSTGWTQVGGPAVGAKKRRVKGMTATAVGAKRKRKVGAKRKTGAKRKVGAKRKTRR